MSAAQEASRRPKFALIAVLMFALLAVATGSAWLIVQQRRGPHDRGAELVEELHERGLSAWWQRLPQARWSLVRRGGRTIGWQVQLRLPTDDGGFEGLTLRLLRGEAGSGGYWEHWALNDSATAGEYRAGEIGISGDRTLTSNRTLIVLSEGVVRAEQTIRFRVSSRAPAPENYAPEGTLPLLRRMAAEAGGEIAFRIVFNEQGPLGGRTSFGVFRMTARPPSEDERNEGAARVVDAVQVYIDGSESEITYLLNEQGRTLSIIAGDTRTDGVEKSEVVAVFPESMDTVRKLSASLLQNLGARSEMDQGFWEELFSTQGPDADSAPNSGEDNTPPTVEMEDAEAGSD
ncbi:MAG: hypothetical protein ACP5HU_08885 [Phycisphaerae bacterium]